MSLKISSNLSLPDEAVTQTFAILAKRGVGKTYTASVMAEEMIKNNLPLVVLDPIGVWWGLRSSADGKKAGLPIIIAGGDHADVPIEPTSGEVVANLVVNEKLSVVIDLSLFRKGESIKFVTDFAETIYRNNRTALHMIIDEADAFAPQRTMPQEARMLGAMEDLVRRGRARGIGVTMITQRPAVLNKNVLTQIEVLVAMRLVSPQDRAAINEWVKVHGDTTQSQELMDSLPSLPIGTAWLWSPGWLDIFKRVKIRKRETLDSSATPKAGKAKIEPRKMADVDLDRIRSDLAATIEKVESEDPKVLRRKIVELEREAANRKPEIKKVETPILSQEDIENLNKAAAQIIHVGQAIADSVKEFSKGMTITVPSQPRPVEFDTKKFDTGNGGKPSFTTPPENDGKLSLAERKILSALAQYRDGRTMTQAALLTGYAVNGGGFRNAVSSLRTKGFIGGRGDIKITDLGFEAIKDEYEPLPTGQALIDYWKTRLGKAERMILEAVTQNYPSVIPIDQVAGMTGYAANGGGFRNALSRLRTLELIEGRSEIKAHDALVGV